VDVIVHVVIETQAYMGNLHGMCERQIAHGCHRYLYPFVTVWILQYIQWIYAKSPNVIGQLSLPVKN
jgi:hypothetical protein